MAALALSATSTAPTRVAWLFTQGRDMDFEYAYTEEDRRFREEVRAWLREAVPPDRKAPVDPEEMEEETYAFFRAVHRRMGAKGWLHPSYPREYGGGGLTGPKAAIITEELAHRKIPGHFSNNLLLPSILVWGTEEQKQKFLPPLLRGDTIAYQSFTESNAGSDLAAIQSRAVRDGDGWLLTGQKVFISGAGSSLEGPNLLYGLFVTDPDAPRHANLGYFLIPCPSPGLALTRMMLLNGSNQHIISIDGVRVPEDHLVGGDHQGWQVARTTLEQEHGGRGFVAQRDDALQELVRFVQGTKRDSSTLNRDPLSQDSLVQLATVDSYIETQINRLFGIRNYSMYSNRQEMFFHGSQSALWRKELRMRNAAREREVMGPYALLGTGEPRAPYGGAPEVRQRSSLTGAHLGGTTEIQKLIMARRLGISRTRERAAPTPATATSYTS